MTRFRFRLERVLDLRRREEEACARDLGAARRAEHECEEALERARAEHSRADAQFAAAQGDGHTVGELVNLDHARDAAGDVAGAAGQRLDAARQHSDAERERFAAARRERRRVELLRERRESEWQIETGREERRTLDDIGARRAPTRREP